MREEARAQLAAFDFAPDPDLPVRQLGFAEQQIVAIAKALRRRCRVLILDEPTAALENREIVQLFAVLGRLRRTKAPASSMCRTGSRRSSRSPTAAPCCAMDAWPPSCARGAFNFADLVAAMTGRAAAQQTIAPATPGERVLEDADARADAIACAPAKSSALPACLGSGDDRGVAAAFSVCAGRRRGRARQRPRAPHHTVRIAAIESGIGLVPPSRRLGLVMNQSVRDNILLPSLDSLGGWRRRSRRAGRRLVAELMDLLDIRPRRPDLKVSALSGGNQQKVILAKWLGAPRRSAAARRADARASISAPKRRSTRCSAISPRAAAACC